MNDLTPYDGFGPRNPVDLTYPPTLPLEVAMKTASIRTICEVYGLTQDDWEVLRHREDFIADVKRYHEELKKDGMSFKMKARLQSEELLKTSWQMIHDVSGQVPPTVRADLIKTTFRVAGLEPSKTDGAGATGNSFQIQINL